MQEKHDKLSEKLGTGKERETFASNWWFKLIMFVPYLVNLILF